MVFKLFNKGKGQILQKNNNLLIILISEVEQWGKLKN